MSRVEAYRYVTGEGYRLLARQCPPGSTHHEEELNYIRKVTLASVGCLATPVLELNSMGSDLSRLVQLLLWLDIKPSSSRHQCQATCLASFLRKLASQA